MKLRIARKGAWCPKFENHSLFSVCFLSSRFRCRLRARSKNFCLRVFRRMSVSSADLRNCTKIQGATQKACIHMGVPTRRRRKHEKPVVRIQAFGSQPAFLWSFEDRPSATSADLQNSTKIQGATQQLLFAPPVVYAFSAPLWEFPRGGGECIKN